MNAPSITSPKKQIPSSIMKLSPSMKILLPLSLCFIVGAGLLQAKSSSHLLGPTGMFGANGKTDIKVTKIDKGSPADGKVVVGDVIVGVNGPKFQSNPRREMAAAIDKSEGKAMRGRLLLELKGGKKAELQLKAYGDFSPTAPANCAKTKALVTAVADQLITDEKQLQGDILAIGWMGLMATGEKKYLDFVKANLPKQKWANPDRARMLDIVNGGKDGGYVGWYWGYELIALSEYYLLTGDKSVLPGIEAYAIALSKGQDAAGIWGHRMTSPKRRGRLPGYAHINQPSLTCFMGLTLAQACGVKDPELQRAIEKCRGFYNTFVGKGTIPYGVSRADSRDYNNNGMSGSAAIAMSFVGDKKAAKFFSRQVATDYDRLETGHATHFFNVLWSPLGANVAGPEVTSEYHQRSRWLYTLYRSWDDRFTHDGNAQKALSTSGTLLLNYCTPRKQLFINGKKADQSLWAKRSEVAEIMNLSQINYGKLSNDELLAMFGHEAPQVRRRAAWTMRDRKGDFLGKIEKMILKGTDLEQESAIGFFGYRCPTDWALPRIKTIGKVLRDPAENMEVRSAAASTLCWYKPQGQAYYNDMLRLVLEDKPGDSFGLINHSIAITLERVSENPFGDGLVTDKDLFYKVAHKLSQHPRLGARGASLQMLVHMPAEDFPKVADVVRSTFLNGDPSSHSYSTAGVTLRPGGQLLARLGIKEGPEWAVDVLRTGDGKGSFKANGVISVLTAYGANSKLAVEEIKADPTLEGLLTRGRWSKGWNAAVKAVESGKGAKPMISFEEAKKGKLAK
jgi:hypothetical protein